MSDKTPMEKWTGLMDQYYVDEDGMQGVIDNEIASAKSKAMREHEKAHEVGIDEIGTTTNPFEHQTQALKARIFHGANRVEFSFFGQQKGRKEAATPESFGKREREDMRDLAEYNEVETTTHASVGVSGLSGLDMRQGIFDDRQRKESMDEIKRAIHFAAEATTGGAVVFHTGEAPRHLYERKWAKEEDRELFEMYPEEYKRRVRYLVDPISKQIIEQVRDIDRIALPVLDTDEKGNIKFLRGPDGKPVIDETLREHDLIFKGKIPLYKVDKDTKDIKTELVPYRRRDEKDRDMFKTDFVEWMTDVYEKMPKEFRDEKLPEDQEEREQLMVKNFSFMKKFLDIQYNLYFGKGSESDYMDLLHKREKVMDALRYYEKLRNEVGEEEFKKFDKPRPERWSQFVPEDVENPIDSLKRTLDDMDRRLQQSKEMAVHGRRQAQQILDMVKRAKPAEEFAVEETMRSMAELGIYAWQKTEEAHKKFKKGEARYDIKNPIYLAPENLFPEFYGSHPQELKNIVKKGRDQMVKELKSRYKMDEGVAKKLSKEHIKATFDIGHANVWWKYFKSNSENESLESRKKRFNKWLLDETKDLIKDGIIGHIHISDNFGFHDEHLTAGDGSAPIKEFVEQAKKEGLKEFIVESGSFNPLTSLPDTWMHFDSPVYGIHVPGFTQSSWTEPSVGKTSYGWNNFYRSYFGRTEGPRFIVGDMSPSEDFKGAPFYTGIGLE